MFQCKQYKDVIIKIAAITFAVSLICLISPEFSNEKHEEVQISEHLVCWSQDQITSAAEEKQTNTQICYKLG